MRAREVRGEVLAGPERRRRWSVEEKLRILAQSVASGSSASLACRCTGSAAASFTPGGGSSAPASYIGMRIRERRLMLGITQAQLAKMIGVTFQQAQKYECGITRVSAGRLFEIARELESPIAYFFEGFGTVRQPLPQGIPPPRAAFSE